MICLKIVTPRRYYLNNITSHYGPDIKQFSPFISPVRAPWPNTHSATKCNNHKSRKFVRTSGTRWRNRGGSVQGLFWFFPGPGALRAFKAHAFGFINNAVLCSNSVINSIKPNYRIVRNCLNNERHYLLTIRKTKIRG